MLAIVGFALLCMIYMNSVVSFAMLVPELFPTEVRLRGTGICNTIGRIVGALTPLAVVSLYKADGITSVIMLMVGALVTQAVVVGMWAVEPSGQSLEALEAALQREPVRQDA
jgi:putative MFS transporter